MAAGLGAAEVTTMIATLDLLVAGMNSGDRRQSESNGSYGRARQHSFGASQARIIVRNDIVGGGT